VSDPDSTLEAARAGDEVAFAQLLAPLRNELRAHCYRMAGSLGDADDLLQESLVRAWRGLAGFEGRSSLRTWMYRVTTHACLDALEKKSARVLPSDVGAPVDPHASFDPPRDDATWLEPCPDDLVLATPHTPESCIVARESVAFAFLVALQLLPPKQRAVLILRDVVGWQASECGELLDLSVAAVNSALQRARATLTSHRATARKTEPLLDDAATTELLARYVHAWEHADVDELVALLHADATLAMPPLSQWLLGAEAIGTSIAAMVFGPVGPGNFRLVPTRANALPAFAVYQRSADGSFHALALHVLELEARPSRIASLVAFMDPRVMTTFGLPLALMAELAGA
jgi:RNA polymerase sigma-70 factor (ECF subfamily)